MLSRDSQSFTQKLENEVLRKVSQCNRNYIGGLLCAPLAGEGASGTGWSQTQTQRYLSHMSSKLLVLGGTSWLCDEEEGEQWKVLKMLDPWEHLEANDIQQKLLLPIPQYENAWMGRRSQKLICREDTLCRTNPVRNGSPSFCMAFPVTCTGWCFLICLPLSIYPFTWESQLRENTVLSLGLSLGTSGLPPLQGFPRHFCWRASESDSIWYCYLRYLPLLILPSLAMDFKCPHSK